VDSGGNFEDYIKFLSCHVFGPVNHGQNWKGWERSGASRDEDDFEKQMRLANESDKTTVRDPPSQTQVDHLQGWFLEKPIPYISNDNFRQEGIFEHWNDQLSG
jgi:hypothetical protein